MTSAIGNATDGPKVSPDLPALRRPKPVEIRTVTELLGMFVGAADACDLKVIEDTITQRGFTVILPDGFVRVQVSHGKHVPVIAEDIEDDDPRPPSDQHPAIAGRTADGYASYTIGPENSYGDARLRKNYGSGRYEFIEVND